MSIPRLNGIIKTLEEGKNAFVCFQPGDTASAQAVATEKYDGVVFEMEHGAYDIKTGIGFLERDCSRGIDTVCCQSSATQFA